jgi:hypothetical protein
MGNSQIENILVGYVQQAHFDYLPIAGIELSALWDAKDTYAWDLYDKCIQYEGVDRELSINNAQYFDEQLFRRFEDKRSGSDPKLEPLQIGCKPNKILKDGLTRLNLIMANKSGGFFYFLASGEGTSPVGIGNKELDNENARVDMRTDGILDAFGNVLFMRARFATGIPDATISEFGACDTEEDPSTFCWRVVLDPTEYLAHVQGETWYNSSHYLVTYSK